MKLTRDTYTVSRKTLELVLEALSNNWFSDGMSDDDGYGECYNNDDVIEADQELQKELQKQEDATP